MKTRKLRPSPSECNICPRRSALGKVKPRSMIQTVANYENIQRSKKYISKSIKGIENSKTVRLRLNELFNIFPHMPFLLAGSLRHLKVEPHYREPISRLWLNPQPYRKTSKIRLTGNWIEKAGFITHERIRVIPMHRMLIIVPETEIETHIDTNENE